MTAPTYPSACTVEQVKAHLRITDQTDDDLITADVAGVNALVWYWLGTPAVVENGWTDAQVHGAVMFAALVNRRRNSPSGVEALGDLTTYVSRTDPQVQQFLGIGAYERPTVA